MSHDFYQEGEYIDYTNSSGSTIPAGTVVLDANNVVILGVTTCPIPDGTTNAIYREQGAVFNADKGAKLSRSETRSI